MGILEGFSVMIWDFLQVCTFLIVLVGMMEPYCADIEKLSSFNPSKINLYYHFPCNTNIYLWLPRSIRIRVK